MSLCQSGDGSATGETRLWSFSFFVEAPVASSPGRGQLEGKTRDLMSPYQRSLFQHIVVEESAVERNGKCLDRNGIQSRNDILWAPAE